MYITVSITLLLRSFFQALIGKSTSKETVFKVDLFAQFIDPFLSFSEKSLAFTILKVSIVVSIRATLSVLTSHYKYVMKLPT